MNFTVPMRAVAWSALLVLLAVWAAAPCAADDNVDFFEKRIRPILVERCLACHSATRGKTQGGLALDTRDGWKKGGDSGSPIVPGKPEESLLIQAIQYQDGAPQMPPPDTGGMLPAAEIQLLNEWVRRGAVDPRVAEVRRGGKTEQELRDWWSFQPLQPVTVPPAPSTTPNRNEIDAFVQSRLVEAGLASSPEADRRTLIRRVTYDLLGLPPTAEEVAAFLADRSPEAYATLVDRLLKSPHYGERWGRHWLDVVRYADTAGENSDHPIPDAWRYRNWVISAFNRDLPYDQFIREQISGDLLHAGDAPPIYAEGVIATGFLAIARRFDHDSDKHMHLTFEDTIDTVGKSLLGLSLACARCHEHKYDPLSSKDYYALYGILNSTRFAFPGCEAKQQPRDLIPLLPPAEWARIVEPYDRQVAALDEQLKQSAATQQGLSAEFKATATGATNRLAQGVIPDGGTQDFQSAPDQKLQAVDVRQGQMLQLTIDPQQNYGADTTLIDWEITELTGQKRRWHLATDVTSDFLAANPHADSHGHAAVWLFLDARNGPSLLTDAARGLSGQAPLSAWRNGENPSVFVNASSEIVSVWTKLAARSVFVHPAPDGAVAVGWVSPLDGQITVRGKIVDAHPGGANGVGWTIDHLAVDLTGPLEKLATAARHRGQLMTQRTELTSQAPPREMAYAVTEGTVGNVRHHLRGDPEKPGEEVPRRWLELFGGEKLPEGAGSGRRQLAHWLTDPRSNPLAARVIVNRIWLQHFGKGLVPTPNDFGTRGQAPTHPQLLDWLAGRFIESGWSIKALHRLILLSGTYQQSTGDPASPTFAQALSVDPNNLLYWRFDRQRLSAEELRDSLLTVSGQLDQTPGGPFPLPQPGSWSYSQHVPFAGVPETNQRSVYQMIVRNRRNLFLSLFDGADPNATTPLRQVTTVPTQSLYFLNDPFFHAQAEKLAQRVLAQPDDASRLENLYRLTLQRPPTASEREIAGRFLAQYLAELTDGSAAERQVAAWSAWARIILSSNEFLYLD